MKKDYNRELIHEALIQGIRSTSRKLNSRTPMTEYISLIHNMAHSEAGMTHASQKFVTELLLDVARLADDQAKKKARNNPIAEALLISGRRNDYRSTGKMAELLRRYELEFIQDNGTDYGSWAYAIDKYRNNFPDSYDQYEDDSSIRKVYRKYDTEALDNTINLKLQIELEKKKT